MGAATCPVVLPVVVDAEVGVDVAAFGLAGVLTALFAPEVVFCPALDVLAEDDPALDTLTVAVGAETRVGAVAPPVPVVHCVEPCLSQAGG